MSCGGGGSKKGRRGHSCCHAHIYDENRDRRRLVDPSETAADKARTAPVIVRAQFSPLVETGVPPNSMSIGRAAKRGQLPRHIGTARCRTTATGTLAGCATPTLCCGGQRCPAGGASTAFCAFVALYPGPRFPVLLYRVCASREALPRRTASASVRRRPGASVHAIAAGGCERRRKAAVARGVDLRQ